LLAAASAWACVSDAARPHPDLTVAWREYQTLPDTRAMAIAGHPGRDRWVTGASGGHASLERAEQEAITQCSIRRARRRIQDACLLYAVGDEIVWQQP